MKREDEFERILRRAQMADKNAMVKIVEMYIGPIFSTQS